jgi:hypothetical protein
VGGGSAVANWEQLETPHRWFSCRAERQRESPYCGACTRKWLAKLADPDADDLDSYVDFLSPPEGA